jgi:hypothetical protein
MTMATTTPERSWPRRPPILEGEAVADEDQIAIFFETSDLTRTAGGTGGSEVSPPRALLWLTWDLSNDLLKHLRRKLNTEHLWHA